MIWGSVHKRVFKYIHGYLLLLGITIAHGLVIILITHWPHVPAIVLSDGQFPVDKVIHFTLYGVFGFLFGLINRLHLSQLRLNPLWLFCALVVFAALDELSQGHFGRTCDFGDWLADAAGAITGLIVAALLVNLLQREASTARSKEQPRRR